MDDYDFYGSLGHHDTEVPLVAQFVYFRFLYWFIVGVDYNRLLVPASGLERKKRVTGSERIGKLGGELTKRSIFVLLRALPVKIQ